MSDTNTQPFFFTWSRQRDATPINIVSGSGATFQTQDGAEWIDLGSLTYQANLGHGHPRLIAAIQAQAGRLCLSSPSSIYPEKTALAKRLLELAPPGFGKVFFTLGGSEATENAIKIARLFTKRYKLISRYRSYHGATMGALTLSGDYRRPPLEPGLAGVIHVLEDDPTPEQWASKTPGRLTNIGRVLQHEGPRSVAAVILESIPGANGILVPHPEYWKQVRAACDKHGTLLIADEVLTGFGRTGRWFAFEHFDVVPDIITLGKALTGGYSPLGAVLVNDRIAKYFDENTLLAGLTHYAHPLGVTAALESIKVYEEEGLIKRAAEGAPAFFERLHSIAARFEEVKEVRGLGYLAALDLGASLSDAQWKQLKQAVSDQHVYIHTRAPEQYLILSPPLCIDEETLKQGLDRLEAALAQVLQTKENS